LQRSIKRFLAFDVVGFALLAGFSLFLGKLQVNPCSVDDDGKILIDKYTNAPICL